jgi:hypothetical protein
LEEIDEKEQDATLRIMDSYIVKERERDVVEEPTQANAAQECETRKRKVFVFYIHNSPLISILIKFSRFHRLSSAADDDCHRQRHLEVRAMYSSC